MWRSYDLTKACSDEQPYAPLGRAPRDDERFAVDSNGYRIKVIDGAVVSSRITVEGLQAARERSIAASDIVICTYPKCGTTWMQQIVLLLLANGDKAQIQDTFKQSPWIERDASLNTEAFRNAKPSVGGRMVWKTHAPATHLPWNSRHADSKMIIVVRNPFDAAVSMWHHARDTGVFQYTGDWDHFLHNIYLTGIAEFGDFWEWHGRHYKALQEQKAAGINNTMWISYEEMKADPCASVRRVAEFIGVPLDDTLLEKVVGGSDFAAMKQQFADMEARRTAAGEEVKKNHIREGKSGTWRKTFTDEQAEMFMQQHKERSARFELPEDMFDV